MNIDLDNVKPFDNHLHVMCIIIINTYEQMNLTNLEIECHKWIM